MKKVIWTAQGIGELCKSTAAYEVFSLCKGHNLPKPDMVFLDLQYGLLDTVFIILQLKSVHAAVKVIVVFDEQERAEVVLELVKAGAHACFLKHTFLQMLSQGLEAIEEGDSWISPLIPMLRSVSDLDAVSLLNNSLRFDERAQLALRNRTIPTGNGNFLESA